MTLLRNRVTEEEIAEVVSRWTAIPLSKMLESEREKLIRIESELHRDVVGQGEAADGHRKCCASIASGLSELIGLMVHFVSWSNWRWQD